MQEQDVINILRSFAERFLEALRKCARILSEFFGKIKACFAKADNVQHISHRTWRRPRNEYAKPLLADKRSRVFHCRNAC